MCDFTKLEKSAYYQAVWAIRHLQKMEIWEQYWGQLLLTLSGA